MRWEVKYKIIIICFPQRNVMFVCKTFVMEIIWVGRKTYTFATKRKVSQMFCESTKFLREMQYFCERMKLGGMETSCESMQSYWTQSCLKKCNTFVTKHQVSLGKHKCFQTKCNIFKGNATVLWEFLGGMQYFRERMQLFCDRMRSFSWHSKCFAREHKVSWGNANVLRELATFFGKERNTSATKQLFLREYKVSWGNTVLAIENANVFATEHKCVVTKGNHFSGECKCFARECNVSWGIQYFSERESTFLKVSWRTQCFYKKIKILCQRMHNIFRGNAMILQNSANVLWPNTNVNQRNTNAIIL